MDTKPKIGKAITLAEANAESEALIDSIGPTENLEAPPDNWPDAFETGLDKDGVFGPPTPRRSAPRPS